MGTHVWILIVELLTLALSVWVFWRGWRTTRSGDTPHCPKCNYILIGIALDRCPECGSVIELDGIVFGESRRRTRVAFAGALLVLTSVYPIKIASVHLAAQVDWIRYRPFTWLLHDLDRLQTADTSWWEIDRRVMGHSLSKRQLELLTEKALLLQTQPNPSRAQTDSGLVEFLGARCVSGELTADQQNRFFDTALQATIQFRQVVGTEDPLPNMIDLTGRGPTGWHTQSRLAEWRIDDGPIHAEAGGFNSADRFEGNGYGFSMIHGGKVGKHRLHVRFDLDAAYRSSPFLKTNGPTNHNLTRELIADFEVVPGHAPIATVGAPSADVLKALMSFQLSKGDKYLSIDGSCKGPPVDLAFDIYLRTGNQETLVSNIFWQKNSSPSFSGGTDRHPKNLPAKVDIILRSSEDVARRTIHSTQIWKGEIVFKDVPVK